MTNNFSRAFAGFVALFCLYHAAEYMIVFRNSSTGFLFFQLLFFVAAYLIGKWQSGAGLAAWGPDGKRGLPVHLLSGVLTGILLYGLSFIIALWLKAEKVTGVPAFADIAKPLSLFLFGNIFSSFSEDVLTRRYIYRLSGAEREPWCWYLSPLLSAFSIIFPPRRRTSGMDIPLCAGRDLYGTVDNNKTPLVHWAMHWAGNRLFFYTHEIMNTSAGSGHPALQLCTGRMYRITNAGDPLPIISFS